MSIRVKLCDIIEGMESQLDESSSYLNKNTGEVILIGYEEMSVAEDNEPLEDYPDWQQNIIKAAKEIENETGDYIQLPTKFDIHEYSIMERFCMSLDDPKMSEIFHNLIKGSGAFNRFKNAIHQYDMADDWYQYRNEAYKEIAVDWCKENNIEFDE